MGEYDVLAKKAEAAGQKIFWLGAASADQIARLETLLSVRLPVSYKRFLADYGGGGIARAMVSGIERNDAGRETGGSTFRDTTHCRREFALPLDLVVIFFEDEEVCWCLDTSAFSGDECPVIAYDVFARKPDRVLYKDFASFMTEHFRLYTDPVSRTA